MVVEISKWGKWKVAWISVSNTNEVSALMESNSVDGVGINKHNQVGATTALLKNLPSLKGLVLTDVEGMDLSSLPQMTQLRFLTLGQKRDMPIDFSVYPDLTDLRVDWHPKDVLWTANSKLSDLHVWSYRPQTRDLSQLEPIANLATLELVQSNIKDLDGIEKQSGLKKLELHYCRSLKSLSALTNSPVELLNLSACSKVESFEVLAGCPSLKSIRMSTCGTIPSLKFLDHCKTLEEFRCVATIIGDNDLSPMLRLNSVAISNRRSYSHTNEELNRLVEARLDRERS